jgi:hypothetical protein
MPGAASHDKIKVVHEITKKMLFAKGHNSGAIHTS